MISADEAVYSLYKVASGNIITQTKYWTTNKNFSIDEKLIKKKLPFVPLVIPQLKK